MKSSTTFTSLLMIALAASVFASPIPYDYEDLESRSDMLSTEDELFSRSAKFAGKVFKEAFKNVGDTGIATVYDNLTKDPVPAPGQGSNQELRKALEERRQEQKAQEAMRKAAEDSGLANKWKPELDAAKVAANLNKSGGKSIITEEALKNNPDWSSKGPDPKALAEAAKAHSDVCSREMGGACSINRKPKSKTRKGGQVSRKSAPHSSTAKKYPLGHRKASATHRAKNAAPRHAAAHKKAASGHHGGPKHPAGGKHGVPNHK
ncbi:hypothetical protein DFP72DRAFT_1074164 [Ephemerocybe angulata]|uniref:Uncharacterized protein n=1 Tax=Ephemerocybe angulata TaxID=980116 RepID=A0A8H6M183_9AGAR|nr:hypothetical protein DFP72DRAFT_1074164 [Tulosesus angulatus]